jgi:hypothetical protein
MPLVHSVWAAKVQHGRGDRAHVDHLDAGGHQALDQRLGQRGARQAPVAPHGHRLFAGRAGGAAEGPAERFGHVGIESDGHDAADVIGLEDRRAELHERRFPLVLRTGHCRQRTAGGTCPKTAS